ncbi:MAG: DNA modification methylase [Alphaproteobacteria bacterium GM202ARS2]|nr:DNA modification methylase [Alphaproteobacteria bacterium GM202ARS2]
MNAHKKMTAREVADFVLARCEQAKQKKQSNESIYKQISAFLKEAQDNHRKSYQGKDPAQSWKTVKGNAIEKIVRHIIDNDIVSLGMVAVGGKEKDPMPKEVKEKLLIDYANMGKHIPDSDIVIYERATYRVIAIVSVKSTLRERVAQTGYWSLKTKSLTDKKHIKMLLVTLDEDGVLAKEASAASKSRAIAEKDTDGVYVISEKKLLPSDTIKPFHQFIGDIKRL